MALLSGAWARVAVRARGALVGSVDGLQRPLARGIGHQVVVDDGTATTTPPAGRWSWWTRRTA